MEENVTTIEPEQNLEDMYLTKRIKKRKITFLVCIAVAMLLALTVIIMSCVKVDLRPSFVTKLDDVTIVSNEIPSGQALLDKESSSYKDFKKIYNQIFNINALSALFTGNFGDYQIEETDTIFNESSSSLTERLGDNYVKLYYSEPQKLKNKDGSDYVSIYRSSYDLTFDTVYFAFDNENVTKELTFYVVVQGNNPGLDSSGRPKRTVTTISLRGNTSALYKTLDEFRPAN